jgi:hypothetical protein
MLPLMALCAALLLGACHGPPAAAAPQRHPGQPGFVARLYDDCLGGDAWACDTLRALSDAVRARRGRE